jgi:hypothetical protein
MNLDHSLRNLFPIELLGYEVPGERGSSLYFRERDHSFTQRVALCHPRAMTRAHGAKFSSVSATNAWA